MSAMRSCRTCRSNWLGSMRISKQGVWVSSRYRNRCASQTAMHAAMLGCAIRMLVPAGSAVSSPL